VSRWSVAASDYVVLETTYRGLLEKAKRLHDEGFSEEAMRLCDEIIADAFAWKQLAEKRSWERAERLNAASREELETAVPPLGS